MSRAFVTGSSQVLYNDTIGSPTKPITFVTRIRITSLVFNYWIFSWGDTTNTYPMFTTYVATGGGGTMSTRDRDDSGGSTVVTSSNNFTEDVWSCMASMWVADNSRKVYLDGTVTTNGSTNGTQTLSEIDRVTLGAGISGGTGFFLYLTGEMAESALYNVELSTAELDKICDGQSPLLVRPNDLISYWRLIGGDGPEVDIIGGHSLTLQNAPVPATHPSIVYPSSPVVVPTGTFAPSEEYIPRRGAVLLGDSAVV